MEAHANDLVSAACLLATKCAQEQEKEEAQAYLISVIAAVLEEAVRLNDLNQVDIRHKHRYMPIVAAIIQANPKAISDDSAQSALGGITLSVIRSLEPQQPLLLLIYSAF